MKDQIMFHVLQVFFQSLLPSFCCDSLAGWLKGLLPFLPSDCSSSVILTLSCITAIFSTYSPSQTCRYCLPFADPQRMVFHLCGFCALSVGQAATMRPWLFAKVAAFLDFQQCIPYAVLVGNLRVGWLGFVLKVSLSLCIRWAGMLC